MNKLFTIHFLLFTFIFPPTLLFANESDTLFVRDMDEIVVVSTPKEHTALRMQPMSSSVFSEQELHTLNVHDLSQLSQYIPSFVMPDYGSRLTSSIYVRGIGSRINNPAVGVYYDNIPLMSKAAFNNHFYMLDRVDVLRGPQGTLYGQNTEGGLVRIYSKNPMNYQGTDIRSGIGNGFYRNVEVAHHHRPSDKLAFTVSGFYTGQKGFINNSQFKEKNDKSLEAGSKVRLIWEPTQELIFDWTADYQWVNQNGFGYGEYDISNGNVADPATTIMNGYKRNMLNTGLSIGYDTGSLLFTSTSSYQFLQDKMQMDQDYMVPDYLRLKQRQKMNAVTQEFVLRSHNKRRWQHTSGLFGSYQWLHTNAPVYLGNDMNAMILSRLTSIGMPPTMLNRLSISDNEVSGDFRTPQLNLGVYHESNLLLTDRLKMTLGLRYDYNQMKLDYDTESHFNMTVNMAPRPAVTNTYSSRYGSSVKRSFNQLLPKIGLTWQIDPNGSNLYAVVSKGFRAGGYNLQGFSDIFETEQQSIGRGFMTLAQGPLVQNHDEATVNEVNDAISYDPETSWNYEIGSHLNLFGGKIHFDLALYYMQIRNQQLSIMAPGTNFGRIMVNAGKSHSCGVETTLHGKSFDDALDWNISYAFTNAKFDEYDNYTDNFVPFVPKHTFSAMADWHIDKLTIGANLSSQGKTWWDEGNTYYQKFYALLGAHADYDFGHVVVTLWGRNLTDTKYNTFAIQSSAAGNTRYFAQRGTPPQFGLDLRLKL